MTPDSATLRDRIAEPAGTDDIDVVCASTLNTHQHAWRGIQRIVVGCDGLPTGEAAVRLAGRLATECGALVRAVMWLDHSQLAHTVTGLTPVEDAISSVDQQLIAATDHPEWWRLTMVTAGGSTFADICSEESADLIILPGGSHEPLVQLPNNWSIPTARVFTSDDGVPRVVLNAATTPDGESTARAIATVIHVVTRSSDQEAHPGARSVQVVTGKEPDREVARSGVVLGDEFNVEPSGRGFPVARVLAIAIVAYFTGICALRFHRPSGEAVQGAPAAQLPALRSANPASGAQQAARNVRESPR
jgi:nucleotide-binding universal stress UspA family protein